MKMSMRGGNIAIAGLKNQLEIALNANLKSESKKLVTDLVAATPIDTGFARSEWTLVDKGHKMEVVNDAPYIEYLNEGSSQQAPANFIEDTALRYGTPVGAITESK